ncbi:RHS repeat-associated core domain-containing protein, partial [Flavobacterium restrictum]
EFCLSLAGDHKQTLGRRKKRAGTYKYRLNSKEYQDELELNVYDMDMRQYDPAIGRWAVIDPVVHYEESPYTGFGNNPVFYADPSGADPYESQADRSGEMSNDEWTAQNRRDIDKQLGGDGVDVATGTYSTAEERIQNEQENNNSTDGGDSEPTVGGIPHSSDSNNDYYWNSVTNSYEVYPKFIKGFDTIKNESNLTDQERLLRLRGSEGITPMEFSSPFFPMAWVGKLFGAIGGSVVAKGITAEGAVWAQKTFSNTFSTVGKFAGKTVESVAGALRRGTLSVSDVPINVVVRNGQTFILNTRSSAALMQAGIPRSAWNVINQTGVSSFESMLTNQLGRNGLINGTSTIRQSGTLLILSH